MKSFFVVVVFVIIGFILSPVVLSANAPTLLEKERRFIIAQASFLSLQNSCSTFCGRPPEMKSVADELVYPTSLVITPMFGAPSLLSMPALLLLFFSLFILFFPFLRLSASAGLFVNDIIFLR